MRYLILKADLESVIPWATLPQGGPPKSSGDSIDSLSVGSTFDGDDGVNLYSKSQNKAKSAKKSAISRKSTAKPVKDPPTKLRTKICIGITLFLGVVFIAVIAWLAKSKFFDKVYQKVDLH